MWFLTNFSRLSREREALNNLDSKSQWIEISRWDFSGGKLLVECNIIVHEKIYAVQLLFPEVYPDAPPAIRPVEKELWSSHQYGVGGDLCLEIGPDNWHPDTCNAAMMLDSAFRLLTLEATRKKKPETEIPSRHNISLGQEARSRSFRFALTPESRDALDRLTSNKPIPVKFYSVFHEKSIVMHIVSLNEDDTEKWVDSNVPVELKNVGYLETGLALALKADKHKFEEFLDTEKIKTFITSVIDDKAEIPKTLIVNDEYGEWHAIWISDKTTTKFFTVEIDTNGLSKRSGINSRELKGKVVSIVGLGSVGSKIAISLCRSGVQSFILVDDDLFYPSNLARHECDWRDVAQHKVDAIAERLALINSKVKICSLPHHLAGQESSSGAGTALNKLKESDLIIDATANHDVFTLGAHIAKRSKIPMLWAEVFAGGIGGLIARAHPDVDADPFSIRQAILDFCADREWDPPIPSIDYSATNLNGELLIAGDAEVSVISAYATQMSLDVLLKTQMLRFPNPIYFVGFKKCFIFDQPYQVYPVKCIKGGNWGDDDKADPETIKDNIDFLSKILKNNEK